METSVPVAVEVAPEERLSIAEIRRRPLHRARVLGVNDDGRLLVEDARGARHALLTAAIIA